MTHPFIFISYSEKDKNEKNQLQTHLRARQIKSWDRDQIAGGSDRDQEIEQAIFRANIAIVLVTANYLSSIGDDKTEIHRLLRRNELGELIIYPIISKHCSWKEDWLQKFKVRPISEAPVWGGEIVKAEEEISEIVNELAGSDFHKSVPTSALTLMKNGLDMGPMVKGLQDLYDRAERETYYAADEAIETCQKGLELLEKGSSGDVSDLDSLPYTRGKFHLLLAHIYQREDATLRLSLNEFNESRDEFASRKWFHLEALCHLGLAIIHRKLNDFQEAVNEIKKAESSFYVSLELDKIGLAVDQVAIKALQKAIEKEFLLLTFEPQTEYLDITDFISKKESRIQPQITEKKLSIFYVSAGQRCIASRNKADLNLLAVSDYRYENRKSPVVYINKEKCEEALYANYILEIDAEVDQIKDGLAKGDWLLIKSTASPNALVGKSVVTLVLENNEIWVGLKTFSYAHDHYFLKAQKKDDESIVIASYNTTNTSRISHYYEGYRGNTIEKYAYDVHVTGKVLKHVRRKAIRDITSPIIWRIPIMSKISAGMGTTIDETEVVDYVDIVDKDEFQGVQFGVRVEGDSMVDFNILSADIALIKRQKIVDDEDIAAVVIRTPEMEKDKPLNVLKQWYFNEKPASLRHVRLKSGNPNYEQLVVIEKGVDEKTIEIGYEKLFKSGKLLRPARIFKNAEISVAGKCIGLVRVNDSGKKFFLRFNKGRFQEFDE